MNESEACPSETPFFIVGNPRSGTTLLTFILSSHPRLHIPAETGFLPQLTKYHYGDLGLETVSEIVHTIKRENRDWRGVVDDVNWFYEALPSKTLACVLDQLYRKQIKDFDAQRWGDKTPSYVRYIPQINQIFSDAQFIHIIRDGRDSTLSAQQKWGKQKWYMDNYYLLKNWSINVEAGRRFGERLGPEQYLEIKYENLVQEPSETIQLVCAFLGEAFHPDMLEHSKLAKKVITPAGHTEVLRPINTQSLGRWLNEMSLLDKKMADALIGETLSQFDYMLANVGALSFLERVKVFGAGVRFHLFKYLRDLLYWTGLLTLNRGKRQ